LFCTYVTFALAFLFDLKTTMTGFRQGNLFLKSDTCQSQLIIVGVNESNYGCSLTENVWVGHVDNFQNVISVALELKLSNISDIMVNGTVINDDDSLEDYHFRYDLYLYTCYDNYGCGSVNTDGNEWKSVITIKNEKVVIADIYEVGESTATVTLLPNTFQNQPALPDNGLAVSYLVYVVYHNATIIADFNMDYKFANINRETYLGSKILLQCCVFITLVVIVLYVRALYTRFDSLRHTLPEQRWILYFLIALVLFQNPVYCVVTWSKRPSVGAVYAVYLVDGAAQAAFFTLWLFFSDGLQRQFSYFTFYVPKVSMGLLMFGTSTVVTTLMLPSVTPYLKQSPVEAVEMWSSQTRVAFISFSVSFLLLLWIWTAWWFISIFRTAKALSKLPYMTSRYLQLWFRFFTLQATLVTLYYVFQYFVIIHYIFYYIPDLTEVSSEVLADGINVR
jgi:hypothetical protein